VDLSNGNALKNGVNTVSMYFINDYRTDGYGFHSFTDQVDQKQYVYTKFEPAFCHYVMPTFDQPDLKATWRLSTLAPKDWTIVSNEFVQDSSDVVHKQALGTLNEAAKVFGAEEIVSAMEQPTVTMFK